mmetsp:Transcript_28610/g.91226  ORF Transcript_28610/g.91226 Transcript_28610/m.91226 type:complete len:204 (-) Transcript_28610:920-1531(-)
MRARVRARTRPRRWWRRGRSRRMGRRGRARGGRSVPRRPSPPRACSRMSSSVRCCAPPGIPHHRSAPGTAPHPGGVPSLCMYEGSSRGILTRARGPCCTSTSCCGPGRSPQLLAKSPQESHLFLPPCSGRCARSPAQASTTRPRGRRTPPRARGLFTRPCATIFSWDRASTREGTERRSRRAACDTTSTSSLVATRPRLARRA